MRIIVKADSKKNIRLQLPTGFLLNGASAGILAAKLKKENINISAKQLRILFRAAKAYKATHPQWQLVDVQSHDGESVEIVI